MGRVDLGKAGEYQFAAELFKHGYVPHWPSAEAIPYDLVYLNNAGLAVKVQVKASAQKGRIDLDVGVRHGKRGRRTPYTKSDCDLLVIWAVEADCWYLIPIANVTPSMSLNPTGPRCKWIPFRNAWHLL